MKIVQVSPFFAPHPGGVESHVRRLSAQLVREGHEVSVVTSRYDRSLPEEEWIDGVRVLRGPVRGVLLNTPIDTRVGETLRRLSADVVHLHYPPPLTPYFAAISLRKSPVPVVLTYHCDLYLPRAWGRLLTGIYERVFVPGLFAQVDRVVVHTRSYRDTSSVLRNREATVVPSLVDVERFAHPQEIETLRQALDLAGQRVILFTGRLVPHKGVDTGLRMLAALPNDVTMLVIGSGPGLEQLEGLARRLGVFRRVRFLPAVDDADLPRYVALCDVFVYPSQNRLEGFGLAVAEAMAGARPVVIADMPGVREVITAGEEGLLAQPMIPADFAQKVETILADPARGARMGERGQQRARERFALERVTEQIVGIYSELIAARR
ncbi:MAG: glycosyltransferase family 4 protein [Thermoplasmata archaeon]